ncbi:uncharacterized protein LOC119478931 isoform X2 [Sebastes umbrosus]|uniref:uncharacterized protein LOC119478931 isoform X2 n=1 Tax=Sebastes umbrosus TaxID=72105 RepID=UPI00189FAEAC|nr:uncharacterized protein LOC119478931 isoform X2 [Sebastes umbrosus]
MFHNFTFFISPIRPYMVKMIVPFCDWLYVNKAESIKKRESSCPTPVFAELTQQHHRRCLSPHSFGAVTEELTCVFKKQLQSQRIRRPTETSRASQRQETYKMATGGIVCPFEYPEGAKEQRKEKIREKTLRGNKDILFYDTDAEGEKCSLMLCSIRVREWLNAIQQKYPELKEARENDKIILKCKESTITLYPTVTVVVTGELMESFERHFPEMKRMALTPSLLEALAKLDINSTGSRHFEYSEGSTDKQKERVREETLRNNKDTLHHDTHLMGEICNLKFYSTHVIEWLNAMKKQYPAFEEIQTDRVQNLKSDIGTITSYPKVTVVVEGQLIERFEEDFPQMRQRALPNEEGLPDEPEGEGTLPTPPNPTDDE